MSVPGLVGVVLAAGAGTRLRPLTGLRPKALCPVANVALLDHAVGRVRAVTDALAVNAHHHREQIAAHLGHAHPDVRLSVEEPVALGTAGALGQLRPWIDGRDVCVVNADAWLGGRPARVLRAFVGGWDRERVRLLCVDTGAPSDFGHRRYAGACLLPWRLVAGLAAVPSGLYEVCWRAQEEAGRLDLVTTDAPFVDCGTPRDYLLANLAASGGRSVIGAGAVVEGEVVRSVVWAGGRVRAGERLVEAIRVGADLTVHAPAVPAASGGAAAPDGADGGDWDDVPGVPDGEGGAEAS